MSERLVGIWGYITSTPGMGGKIKGSADDFYVEEVAEIKTADDGDYLIIRVKKKNWDTMNLVRVISNVLGISQKRISFAGTKDKRAISVQFMSIKGVKAEEIERIRLKDVEIEVIGYSRKPVQLGDLLGNRFRVRVENCTDGEVFEETKRQLMKVGTPNFFGLQRFGVARCVTHEVGKLILQRRYSDAFWTYVAKPFEGENDEVRKLREELWNTRDVKFGLRELPKYLRYERTLLQKLREGKSEREALLSLPKNLKMMFIHAYQSYVFNRLLSERIREFGSLKTVQEGDWACYLSFSGIKPTFHDCSRIGANMARVKYLIAERVASLALPLVGYNTKLEGWNLKAKEILSEDDLELESFRGEYKEFSSAGAYRAADMLIEVSEIEFHNGTFEFYLPKGCYATVMLREFLKRELS